MKCLPALFFAFPLFAQNPLPKLPIPQQAQASAAFTQGLTPGAKTSLVSGLISIPEQEAKSPMRTSPVSETVRHQGWTEGKVGVQSRIKLPFDISAAVQFLKGKFGNEGLLVVTKQF